MKSYYSKSELLQTPSIEAGLTPENETKSRIEGVRLIIEIGSSMGLSPQTVATGAVYFHRFYMIHTFQDFPRFPTACACLFLAGKVEETPKKCKDIIKAASDIFDEEKFKNEFQCDRLEQKSVYEEMMALERVLLLGIKFNLQVEHPYTFLIKYAKGFKGDKPKLEKVVQMAWTFVNDSLCTTLCLQWEPEIIAIALIFLAGKLCRMEIQDWEGRRSGQRMWWEMYVTHLSLCHLEDICHQVLDLYAPVKNVQDSSQGTSAANLNVGTKRSAEGLDFGEIPLPPGPSPLAQHSKTLVAPAIPRSIPLAPQPTLSSTFATPHLPIGLPVLPPPPSHFIPPHHLSIQPNNPYLMQAAQNFGFIPGAFRHHSHPGSSVPGIQAPPPPIIRPS